MTSVALVYSVSCVHNKNIKPQLLTVMNERPILYIKPGCVFCREAVAYLQAHGIECDLRDVTRSATDLYDMIEVSGQMQTPTLEFEGRVLSGFFVNELICLLNESPEACASLGIESPAA